MYRVTITGEQPVEDAPTSRRATFEAEKLLSVAAHRASKPPRRSMPKSEAAPGSRTGALVEQLRTDAAPVQCRLGGSQSGSVRRALAAGDRARPLARGRARGGERLSGSQGRDDGLGFDSGGRGRDARPSSPPAERDDPRSESGADRRVGRGVAGGGDPVHGARAAADRGLDRVRLLADDVDRDCGGMARGPVRDPDAPRVRGASPSCPTRKGWPVRRSSRRAATTNGAPGCSETLRRADQAAVSGFGLLAAASRAPWLSAPDARSSSAATFRRRCSRWGTSSGSRWRSRSSSAVRSGGGS